jgi:predicted adenylyl cyclase CyaB
MTRVRVRRHVRYRADDFGGICYVPQRDDFFALSRAAFRSLSGVPREFSDTHAESVDRYRALVELGIVETDDGSIVERAYSGPSLIGSFPELPTVTRPLVINCFATAWCPLLCRYCHADDLMTADYRNSEGDDQVPNVLATARALPAMVAVITGGDPLSAPARTTRLIEGLSPTKALVLDTSGMGRYHELIPVLVQNNVHVRVSLDNALRGQNDTVRPVNPAVANGSAWDAARNCIADLLGAGVAVSVQSVVTSDNDQLDDWLRLREILLEWGVRHWVLHMVVAGGKARRVEERARGNPRIQRLRPGPAIGVRLWALVRDTMERGLPIDIRCTDTDDRPNSVLLVASNGDLFTEGFARKGKVPLYRAAEGHPDTVQSLMAHLDRFGHARRYLNWNPWFEGGKSIEEVCIPFGGQEPERTTAETEFKFRILDMVGVRTLLADLGFEEREQITQRDEYFDSENGLAQQNDYVIRVRDTDGKLEVALKGPRFYSRDGASSRVELEVPTTSLAEARLALERKGLRRTWYLEKRRQELFNPTQRITAAIDEVPRLGQFLELEGGLEAVRAVVAAAASCLGPPETKNYRELAVANSDSASPVLEGLAFEAAKPT